jgi:phage terminase small subunit
MPGPRKLTGQQKLFVAEYLIDMNASQAAIRAGYSKTIARRSGSRLLATPHVAEAIEKAQRGRVQRTQVTADQVVNELALIAFSDISEVFDVDGNGRVTVKDLKSLPPAVRRAISDISQVSTETKGENGVVVEKVRLKVGLHSKIKAIELLMDHLGMKPAAPAPTVNVQQAVLVLPDNGRLKLGGGDE